MGIDFLLLPCMVISAWLSFVLFVLGRAINSPDHLIAVPQELKRSKEIASYVTASLHMLTAFACAFLKYRKARVELRVVNNARPTIAD